eukprot:m.56349 g.56349  ORF g.56349 m.56349 type:complete len:614 (+) comp13009_c1_seq4:187-2028(+)
MRGSLALLLLGLTCTLTLAVDLPFWPHYPARTTGLLNGQWEFGFVENISDVINFNIANAFFNATFQVPGAFDVRQPGVLGPRGTAFYRTNFTLSANTPGLLYFAACSFYCQVFVDGKSLGDHRAGGYQPFWIQVPASTAPQRELIVLVDNRFNGTTAPTHTGGDFYHFGGITRDVILHEIPSTTYILQVETFTLSLQGDIRVRVVLGGDVDVSWVHLALQFDGQAPTMSTTVDVMDGVATLTATVPNATLWSPSQPNLHTLLVTLNGGADAVLVRFGLRLLGIDSNARITINGDEVKLRGFNRHTMWPDTGSALTLEQVEQDIALLKEVGANYVRGAHYPQDQRFLDLCDENGIMIWEETLGPSVTLENLLDPYWLHYQLQAVNEMVSASINHPCVIFHAFYNEGPSDQKLARPGYNASAAVIRARVGFPPSRLVTWASNKKTSDVCLDITDVISFNSYPAWYDHPGDLNQPKIFWQSQVDWVQQNWPQKPFTISETGAGAIYEWQNTTDTRWSQKYQAEVVQQDIEFALQNNRVSGLTIWQFSDIKANDGDTQKAGPCVYAPHPASLSQPWNCTYIDVTQNRPGGENHKGVVDFWRRKKAAFATAQALYTNN